MDGEVVKNNIELFDKDELYHRVTRRLSLFKGQELMIPKTAHRYFTHLTNCYTYGFYFACVPFAGMCLEFVLKEFIVKCGGTIDENNDTLGSVIYKAHDIKLINDEELKKLKAFLEIRNRYVHVKKTEFENVIFDGVLERNKEIRVAPPSASSDAYEMIELMSDVLSVDLLKRFEKSSP